MVEFLVGADPIAERVRAVVEGGKLAAPHAIDLECAAALRGLVRGKKLPAAEAERALELLGSMRLKRYGHVPLLARIWQLRHNMWPYDAAYVALAEGLDAELVTLDGKIETIPGVMCPIRNLRGLRAISGHRGKPGRRDLPVRERPARARDRARRSRPGHLHQRLDRPAQRGLPRGISITTSKSIPVPLRGLTHDAKPERTRG